MLGRLSKRVRRLEDQLDRAKSLDTVIFLDNDAAELSRHRNGSYIVIIDDLKPDSDALINT
jgi:hypothetical protein